MEENKNEGLEEEKNNQESPRKTIPLMVIIAILAILAIGTVFFVKSGGNKNSAVAGDSTQSFNSSSEENSENVSQELSETNISGSNTDATANISPSDNITNSQIINVEGGMYYFKPNEIKVKKGVPVKIVFSNVGGNHDFVIDELNVKSKLIGSGQTDTVEFTPDKIGTFEFYCSVGNHRAMGMKGILVVE
jgi:plastocyanin